jgi:hypothetical protein
LPALCSFEKACEGGGDAVALSHATGGEIRLSFEKSSLNMRRLAEQNLMSIPGFLNAEALAVKCQHQIVMFLAIEGMVAAAEFVRANAVPAKPACGL